MAKYYSSPKADDIVQCRFPQDKIRQPGPKQRPALVIDVEEYELPDGSSAIFVTVAYGTSEDVDNCHPGELNIESSDPHAALSLAPSSISAIESSSRLMMRGSLHRQTGASACIKSGANSI